jgi:hypothetical protein
MLENVKHITLPYLTLPYLTLGASTLITTGLAIYPSNIFVFIVGLSLRKACLGHVRSRARRGKRNPNVVTMADNARIDRLDCKLRSRMGSAGGGLAEFCDVA